MWFGVLGPLEVSDDGGKPLTVPPTRQRLLLAVLLCTPGRPVAIDRLVDQVWQGDPPENARANVQLYVHRLRRVLGQERIVHQHGGYALVASPDEVDSTRFAALTEAGAHAEALALWRGEPFEGIDEVAVVREEAARLNEARIHVHAARVDDGLADGEHSSLVADLTSLVAQHPLDEGLRARLMLALYRAGRAVDALTVFQEGRTLLVDELGLEPGPALRDLQERILAEDPSLTADSSLATDRTASSAPTPAEVPPPPATFAGRTGDVERVAEALISGDERTPVVAVTGIGGVGKSALAVQTAHRVAENFPDGQLYVNLQGATPGFTPLEPIEVIGRFLHSLGVADTNVPNNLEEAAARLRSVTADKALLIVLDDAADAAQVRPLLPGGRRCAVLITSRAVLTGVDGALNLGLAALEPDSSYELLVRRCGAERLDAEPAATRELVDVCGGLPLALCLAAARLARRPSWPVSALVTRLRDRARRLDELAAGDLAVRSSFAVSYEDVSEAAARIFAIVALLDVTDVGVPTVAAAAAVDEPTAETLLDELVDAQVFESGDAGRFGMHDLIRLFARERAAADLTPEEQAAAIRRVALHILATAYEVAEFQSPGSWRQGSAPSWARTGGIPMTSDADVNDWLRAERHNLLDLAREIVTVEGDGPRLCASFANLLFAPLNTRGQWHEIRALNRLAIEETERTVEALETERALALNDLGWTYAVLGRGEESMELLTAALDHWTRSGHRHGEAHTRRAMVKALTVQGRPQDALDQGHLALDLFTSMRERTGEIDSLIAIGLTHAREGDLEDAIATHEKALAIATEVSDDWHRGAVLGNLGELYRRDQQHARARDHFEEALLVDRTVGNSGTYYEAEHLWGLGSTLCALGDAHAHSCWDRSAWILRDLGLIGTEEYEALCAANEPEMPGVIAAQL